MAFRKGLFNFSKGELSPDLYGRVDIAPYNAGVRRARNVLVMKYGGMTNRPGTEFIAEVEDPANPVRLFPFQFDDGKSPQNYALEMGQGYMRLAAGGGMVVEDLLAVHGITKANPAVVNVPYHAYAVGDKWAVSGQSGMTEINDRIYTITAIIDADHFAINVDSTSWGVWTADSGGATRVATPPPPPPPPPVPPPVPPDPPPDVWGGGGGGIRNCVADDTLILMADGSERPASELKVGDMVRTQHENFAGTAKGWGDYPIETISFTDDAVFFIDVPGRDRLYATGAHRVWSGGKWRPMRAIGHGGGVKRIAKITVADAHTYFSGGILSHNIKQDSFE